MKVEVEELTDLFTVIKKRVEASNIPAKKKKSLIKQMQNFAKIGFDLGKGDIVVLDVPEE